MGHPPWGQTFTYDSFGNVKKSGSISWLPNYSVSNNNQYQSGWNGVSYDADGNLLNDTFNTYTWDAYGDMASVNGNSVTYDALGRFVEYDKNGTFFQFVHSTVGIQPLAYMAGQTLGAAGVSLPGGGQAVYYPSGLALYNHPDWLGSAKLYSTPSRTGIGAMSYAPFGEGYAGGQQWIQFTETGGDWLLQDNENQTGSLVDFGFRHYNPTQGRWISPDPAGLAAVDPRNPQSWNRYAYVMNNPLSMVDPLGLECAMAVHGMGFHANICSDPCSLDGGSACGGGGGGGSAGGGGGGGGACDPSDPSCSNPNGPDPTLFGSSIYDLPGYGNPGAEALGQYITLLATTVVGYQFSGGDGSNLEHQKELAAIQLGQRACADQDPTAIANCIQDAYDTLVLATPSGQDRPLVGGNYNFDSSQVVIPGADISAGGLGCTWGRCGIIDSLHFHDDGTFHVDTANPYFVPAGSLIHLIFDVIGGHSWWSGGIPRPWW